MSSGIAVRSSTDPAGLTTGLDSGDGLCVACLDLSRMRLVSASISIPGAPEYGYGIQELQSLASIGTILDTYRDTSLTVVITASICMFLKGCKAPVAVYAASFVS